ncbi:MAG TPA: twin-arginine translocase TatA/TatE family subunit [Bacteroidia bacterium]
MTTATILLGMLGTTEIILIVIVVLLLFGGKKIPELMRGLGQGMKEFKDAQKGDEVKPGEKNLEEKK